MLLDVSCPARGSARRKTQPALAVVANDDPFAEIHAELRAAFLEVAACRRALDGAERRVLAARDAYAAAHGYVIKPGVERLRDQFGPRPESAQ